MRILIQKIESEEIFSEIDDSVSLKIVGGGSSQYANISASGSTNNGYAGVNLKSWSFGSDRFLQFGASLNVIETDQGVSSSSSAYVRSGSS